MENNFGPGHFLDGVPDSKISKQTRPVHSIENK